MDRLELDYPPDAVERQFADPAQARRELELRRSDILLFLAKRRVELMDFFGTVFAPRWNKAEAAIGLSLCRLAVRHGGFGSDFHPYHNESHALEILQRRLGRMMGQLGLQVLSSDDWIALTLFATCHDLRQREVLDPQRSIGSNEAASIAETYRILDCCGFNRNDDHPLYLALEIMIAGSTFDANLQMRDRKNYNTAEAIHSGGPLAPHLEREVENIKPQWRNEASLEHALELAKIASDLDTANVSESFVELCNSAARLASEREMRSGRSLQSTESGASVLSFLSNGQERYFFELHSFCSSFGNRIFGPGKTANTEKVREISRRLQACFNHRSAQNFTGEDVLAIQHKLAWELL